MEVSSNLLEKKNEFAKFLVYLGEIALQKICYSMVSSILAQWDWAKTADPHGLSKHINTKTAGELLRLSGNLSDRFSNTTMEGDVATDISWSVLSVLMISPVMSFILAPVFGILGDKFGYNVLLLVGLTASLTMDVLLALFSSFGGVLSAFVFLGLSDALISPNSFAAVNTVYSPGTRKGDVAMGIAMTMNLIGFLGPAIIGTLYEYAGQLICFLGFLFPYTLIILFGVILICIFDKSDVKLIKDDPLVPQKEKEEPETSGGNSMQIYTNYELLLTAGALGVAFFPRKSIESVISVWMESEFSSGSSIVGLVLSSAAVGVLIGNISATFFAVHYHKSVGYQSATAMILAGISTILFSVTSSPLHVSIIVAVYIFFGTYARYSAINIISSVGERMKSTPRSRVMSMATSGFSISNWVSPLVSVPLYNAMGFRSTCRVIGPVVIFYGLMMIIYYTYPETPQENNKSDAKVQEKSGKNGIISPDEVTDNEGERCKLLER